MPISATCPSCKTTFRVPDELAGKKVKCQKCQTPFIVAKSDSAPAPKKPVSAQISAGEPKPKPKKKAAAPPPMIDTSRYKKKSGCSCLTLVLLFFVGGGLLTCIGGGVVGWWYWDEIRPTPPGPIAAADKKVKDKKADKARDAQPADGVKADGIKADDKKDKDVPPADGKKDKSPPADDGKKDKSPPPIADGSKDATLKDKKDPPPPPPPAGIINITLGPDGAYRSDSTLADTDPPNSVNKRPQKTYQVTLKADQKYQIDMVSEGFSPYLFLFDENRKKITEDEDSGGPTNARIIYTTKAAGVYRIQATTLGPKLGKFILSVRVNPGVANLPEIKPPDNKPPDIKPPVSKPPEYVPVGSYNFSILAFPKETRLVGNVIWSRDGKSYYVLTAAGRLVSINADNDSIAMEKEHAQKCGNLALSAEGLLVSALDAQEIWVFDPDKLDAAKKKISVPGITRVTAGVDAKVAVAAGAGKAKLSVVDLELGAVLKQYPDLDVRHVTASPDGKFVFAQSNTDELLRFRLDKDQLTKEDESPRIATEGQGVSVSSDSKYVCLPATGGNGVPGMTNIYSVANLKLPAFRLNSGPNPQAVGFDPKNRFVVTQNNVKPIMIFMYTGNKRAEFEVKDFRGNEVREFAISPLGYEMLMRADDRVIHIKFNKK